MALLKLDFKPGVNKEDTPYTNEGGWVESDKIRFRSGRPEKIGGWTKYQNTTVEGVTRRLHPFRTLDGTNYLAIGTTEKVYVETGGTFIDITPIRDTLTTAATDNCISVDYAYPNRVNFAVTSHGCDDGAWVTVSGVESGVSTTLSASITDTATSLTLTSSVGFHGSTIFVKIGSEIMSGTNSGGTISSLTRGVNGTTAVAHTSGDTVELYDLAGIPLFEINAEHKITVSGVNNFYATVSTGVSGTNSASSTGGTAIDIECQINPGVVNGTLQYGFGSGAWAAGTWGTVRSSAIPLDPRVWNFASWGEDLIVNYQGGPLYYWDASNATDRATLVTQAPYQVDNILVTQDRHLVCLGCNPPGTANALQPKDNLQIRWSDQEDYTAWTVTATNTAGDQLLTNGTRIVGAISTESQNVIWTDSDVQSMQFLGPPYTFGFNQIGTFSGLISSRAAAAYNNVVYWMGDSAFYVFQGGTNVLPCTVQKYVFDAIDLSQRRKIFCTVNRRDNEITWFYPATSQDVRYLNGAIGTADTTIQLESTAGLPTSGQVFIKTLGVSERVSYTAKNDTQLLNCSRAVLFTTAAVHNDGDEVTLVTGSSIGGTSWSQEPYHYVTYNVVDKLWWVGTLERTAMVDSGELSNPIGVDVYGQLFYHEDGYDADGNPLVAYVQSGDFDIGEGDSLMHIHRVIPDFTIDGSLELSMQTKYYPLADEVKETIGTVTSSTTKINTRIRARNMALRIKSKALNDWWKYGSTRIDQRTDGRR